MLLIVAGVLIACEKFTAAGVFLVIYGCLHSIVSFVQLKNSK